MAEWMGAPTIGITISAQFLPSVGTQSAIVLLIFAMGDPLLINATLRTQPSNKIGTRSLLVHRPIWVGDNAPTIITAVLADVDALGIWASLQTVSDTVVGWGGLVGCCHCRYIS